MMEDSLLPTGVPVIKRVVPYLAAVVVGGAGIGYAVHEHNSAQTLASQNAQVTAQLNATNSQLNVLAAKINALADSNQARQAAAGSQGPAVVAARKPRAGVHRTGAQDARFKKMQAQLDAQGKAIEDERNDLASTRNDLSSAKSELGGSIAKTHDELVLLQKKGERNYYEFDLDKSKQFKREGPVGISLRKANEKHQYADLQLMVDDRTLQQKHVNLYQPAMFYQPDSPQPIEIVINEVGKNHIHGYVSAPKYRQSELASASDAGADTAQGGDQGANPSSQPPTRKRITPGPENETNQQ